MAANSWEVAQHRLRRTAASSAVLEGYDNWEGVSPVPPLAVSKTVGADYKTRDQVPSRSLVSF